MKTTAIAFLISASAFAAVPVIDADSVSVKQDGSRTVVISYKLEPASAGDTEPAIITADILTNGVSVGGGNLWTLSGDVNRIVSQGNRKILWQPNEEKMPEFSLPAAQVTAKITAWSTDSPPNYWVIDLRTSASMKDRLADRYYPNAEQIPLTVTNKIYKTERLVFRRIPAKGVTWRQGDTDDPTKRSLYRYVTFSYDYWIGVYEFTVGQFNRLRPSSWENVTNESEAFPRRNTFGNWRGDPNGSSEYNWPSNGHDKVAGIIGNGIRPKLGGVMVDIATAAEWEYACRAGSSTKYCNGDTKADLDKVAWYGENSGGVYHDVGTKLPNAWGVYDMHGNCWEWTLDKSSKRTSEPVWDPTGPMQDEADTGNSGNYKNKCMGAFGGRAWADQYEHGCEASDCTSASNRGLLTGEGATCTIRLVIPLQ